MKKLVLWILILCSFSLQAEELYLQARASSYSKIDVLINTFTPEPGTEADWAWQHEVRKTITDDLNFSGYFRVILTTSDNKLDSSSMINTIVNGKYSFDDEKVALKIEVFDLSSTKIVHQLKFETDQIAVVALAHKVSSNLINFLTGEKSITTTQICFVHKEGNHKELWLMDFDGKNQRRLTFHGNLALSPDWSPDGKQIIYNSYHNGNPNLYIINMETGKTRPLIIRDGLNSAPSWSPDGEKIAFTISNNGDPDIYYCSPNGRKLLLLSGGYGIETSPSWSPSSQQCVFTSDRSGNPQIYRTDLSDRSLERITWIGKFNESPAWSPDGDRIAFASMNENGNFNICTIDIYGEDLKILTDSKYTSYDGEWSPDGRHIVYTSEQNGRPQIWIMDADGKNKRQLTFDSENTSPAWSPFIEK